ncbi:hypothetical protein Tco_0690622, partial [Tanacetum coccineum]
EVVFNDDERTILFRMNIQSLAPELEIDTSVIDAYVSILNYEEKIKMTNMKRHFFYTSMMVPRILEDKTKEIDKKIDAQYDRFHEMLSIGKRHRKNENRGRRIGKPMIIDNSESDATYEGKYKDNVEIVIRSWQDLKSNKLKNEMEDNKRKIRLWFMIMHIELYEGSTAAQWKTCLLPENDKNHQMQMDNLRSRIAAKILLHEVNIYQKKISDYAKKMTGAGEGGSNRE